MHGKPTALIDWIAGVGVILCAALAWLAYWRWKDHQKPEPLGLTAFAFLLGGASAGVALFGYRIAIQLGLPGIPGGTTGSIARFCLLTVGPVEEGAKFLVAWLLLFRHAEFDEEIDGLVYATAVALGFASVENVLYLPLLPWGERLARSFATPLSHAVFSALWGMGYAHAKFSMTSRGGKTAVVLVSLALAMLAHGLYDFVELAYDATLVAGLLVFSLWWILVLRARWIVASIQRPGPLPVPQCSQSLSE